MAILEIRVYPDPVLRVRCPEVEVFDDDLRRLAANMVETVHAAPGIGLAAPQVGVETRLAIVDVSVGEDPEELLVLVNPKIVERDGKTLEPEGCLSLPGFSEKVPRAAVVTVSAQDLQGEPLELRADGLRGRAIQHEIDHLDGILFVDHLRGLKRERAERQLRRFPRQGAATT